MSEYHEYHEYGPPAPEEPTVPMEQQTIVETRRAVPVAPVEQVETVHRVVTEDVRLRRLILLIYYFFGLLDTLLFIRFVLRLMGANPASPFAMLVYGITEPFLFLFYGLLPTPRAGPSVFEFTTLVAIVIYALVALAIVRLIRLLYARYPS